MKLHVNFDEGNYLLKAQFVQTECTFNIDFGEVVFIRTDDKYEGDYTVIPRVYQQMLDTKDKLMLDNVTVEIIPLSKIINPQNGYTVTIG